MHKPDCSAVARQHVKQEKRKLKNTISQLVYCTMPYFVLATIQN